MLTESIVELVRVIQCAEEQNEYLLICTYFNSVIVLLFIFTFKEKISELKYMASHNDGSL